jgi:hypothetical protein
VAPDASAASIDGASPDAFDAPLDDAAPTPADAAVRITPPVDAAMRATVVPDAARVVDAAASLDSSLDAATFDPRPLLAQLRADLDGRGILEADLPQDARAAIGRLEAARRTQDAEAALADAQHAIAGVRVDEAFVRRKLERTSTAIRNADRTKVDVGELDRLAAAALDDLLDQRYDSCNRRLNQIARVLAHGTQ